MKKTITVICLMLAALGLFAQNVSVRGTVKDQNGVAVGGVAVVLKGSTKVGALTDAQGRWNLTVPAGSTLEASCLGYKTETFEIGNRTVFDIVLQEDNEELEEVVVVGYGSMRRSDITGAVTSVRIDEDEAIKSTTLDQLLEGRAAGVQVLADNSNPDAGVSIRIRGLSTFSGHSDPLYVVDGVIIEGESNTTVNMFSADFGANITSERESTNALAGINPQDIASIEVLKDASATAIYGSQGANGVVLITTKQATKDKPAVNFNAGVYLGFAGRKVDVLTYDQYEEMVFKYNSKGDYKKILYDDPDTRTGRRVTPMDWQDYVFRTAVSQRYYYSIAGKPKGYNYLFSVGYNNTQGVLECTDSEALSARLNLSRDIIKNVKVSFKSTLGYTSSNLINGANSTGSSQNSSSVMASAMFSKPFRYGSVEEEGEDVDMALEDANERYSPARSMNGATNKSERLRVTPSLMLDWKILKYLSFRSTFGADVTFSQSRKTKNNIMSLGHGNIAGVAEVLSSSYNWDNLLLLNWKSGRHNLSGTLGQSVSKRTRLAQSLSAQGLPQFYAIGFYINEATQVNSYYTTYSETVSSLLSFFGRAVYNYADRYILTATLRYDGSSKFLGANKWGVFPSAAFAWRISGEPWFYVRWISNAKLRLGWGESGNQNIGSYLTGYVYTTESNSSHFGTGKILGILSSNIANAGLKWETTTQENAGLDLSFFRGRLTFTADAYRKDTRDLLQSKAVAYSTGFTSMNVNDGWIRNTGLEFAVEAVPVRTKNVEWMLGANISFNRNTVMNVGAMGDSALVYLDQDSEPVQRNFFYGDKIFNSMLTAPLNIFIEGMPMGLFYGYVTDGIVQEGESVVGFSEGVYREEGTLKYKDLNRNGIWDDGDRTIIGNPHPKFTYGFNTSLCWKSFSIKADFAGAYKFSIANMNAVRGYSTNLGRNCFTDAYVYAWTPENKNNRWPKFGAADDDLFSDRLVEDGSWFRVSNVSLSYEFKIGKDSKVLRGLALTASVGNPFLWSRYSGYNPTTNSYGNNVKRMGVDLNSTPFVRSYNFDVKFRF